MSNPIETVRSIPDFPRNITALVGLGKQYGIDSNHQDILDSPDHLSVDSRITVKGLGYLCLDAMADNRELRVLFSGNKRALFPEVAVQFMTTNFPQVPPSWYENPDEDSVTTEDSARRVPTVLREEGHQRVGLATVDFHIGRSVQKFNRRKSARGLIVCAVATDGIVGKHSSEEARGIEAWRNSERVIREAKKETFLRYTEVGAAGSLIRAGAKAYRSVQQVRRHTGSS